jgi:hypothetical protein
MGSHPGSPGTPRGETVFIHLAAVQQLRYRRAKSITFPGKPLGSSLSHRLGALGHTIEPMPQLGHQNLALPTAHRLALGDGFEHHRLDLVPGDG